MLREIVDGWKLLSLERLVVWIVLALFLCLVFLIGKLLDRRFKGGETQVLVVRWFYRLIFACAALVADAIFVSLLLHDPIRADIRAILASMAFAVLCTGLAVEAFLQRVEYSSVQIRYWSLRTLGRPTVIHLDAIESVTCQNDRVVIVFAKGRKIEISSGLIGFTEFLAFLREHCPCAILPGKAMERDRRQEN